MMAFIYYTAKTPLSDQSQVFDIKYSMNVHPPTTPPREDIKIKLENHDRDANLGELRIDN